MDEQQQLPPVLKAYAQAAHAAGADMTEKTLKPGRSSRRVDDLVRRMHREFDRAAEEAFASLPGDGAACAPGCDHCCRTLRVTVSPVEVFSICHRLREDGDTHPRLQERLSHTDDRVPGEREPTACPLLGEDGLCIIYSSRPLACRGCVSADATLCAACDDERPVPRSMVHHLGAAALLKGVTDALDSLGLAGEPTELRAAIALAWRDEDLEKRWLRGERVFPPYQPR